MDVRPTRAPRGPRDEKYEREVSDVPTRFLDSDLKTTTEVAVGDPARLLVETVVDIQSLLRWTDKMDRRNKIFSLHEFISQFTTCLPRLSLTRLK